jgi:hypothetical protein
MNLIDIAVNGYKPMPTELRAFATSVKNQRNQMDVVTGSTFQNIEIISNITDVALIHKIQVELNGQMIVDLTATELKMIESYSKRTRSNGRYVIPFYRPEARTMEGMRLGELVTLPTDQMTVFVTFGETLEVKPTLRARALVTPSQSVRYFLPKLDTVNVTASDDGENLYSWSNRSAALFIRRLHFFSPHITKLKVFRDDLKVFEATKEDNNADLSEGLDSSPQTNFFHFDPAHGGFHLQGLFPTIARKALDFKYDISEAGNVRVIRETIEQVASTRA